MKPKGIVFFDLDGTLLNEHSQVSKETRQAIVQLKENNILPVICSGRTYTELEEIGRAAEIDSFIAMNGQHSKVKGDVLYAHSLDKKLIEKVIEAVNEKNDNLTFINSSGTHLLKDSEMARKSYEFLKMPYPKIDPHYYQKNEVNMLLIITDRHDDFYQQAFPELNLYRNNPYSIDTIHKNYSKGTGVKEFLEALNFKDVKTYGFGDGLNDLALLSSCHEKIAMENAKEQLKKIATFITKSNRENGIVYALNHYRLIGR